jgi:hypothetical protein
LDWGSGLAGFGARYYKHVDKRDGPDFWGPEYAYIGEWSKSKNEKYGRGIEIAINCIRIGYFDNYGWRTEQEKEIIYYFGGLCYVRGCTKDSDGKLTYKTDQYNQIPN